MDKIIPADTLVSIGVPVRNGADWLADALEQLINQTHQNLEIILSNNNSTDGTDKICQRYAERDSRIRYTRHNTTLGAADSFRYVLDQARADYFMWAAHDDRHSLNYVQKLLEALMANKNAALAFSEVAIFHHPDTWRTATPRKYKFECNGQGRFWRGLLGREYTRDGYLHIYGLIRKSAIQSYPWPTIELGGDRPLLLFLWCRGSFIKAEGACFYCYKPEQKKSKEQRATYASGKGVLPFPYTRLSWACAQSAYEAEKQEGRRRSLHLIFLMLLIKEIWKKAHSNTRKSAKLFLDGFRKGQA